MRHRLRIILARSFRFVLGAIHVAALLVCLAALSHLFIDGVEYKDPANDCAGHKHKERQQVFNKEPRCHSGAIPDPIKDDHPCPSSRSLSSAHIDSITSAIPMTTNSAVSWRMIAPGTA